MKNITIIFLTFLSLNLYSQINEKLDSKNGFKEFRFGDDKSKYLDKITLNSKKGFVEDYYYTESGSLFNKKWEVVNLSFYKNKLSSIVVYFPISNTEHISMLQELRKVFGNYSELYEKAVQTKSYYQWYGKKVGMALIRYKAKSPAPEVTVLHIKSLLLEKKKLENDF